jgi:hypothetical protein
MTQYGNTPVQSKPQPNVYTVLLVIGILALLAGIFVGFQRLTGSVETGQGYGMEVGELFQGGEQETEAR